MLAYTLTLEMVGLVCRPAVPLAFTRPHTCPKQCSEHQVEDLDEAEEAGAEEQAEGAADASEQVSSGERPVLINPHHLHRPHPDVHLEDVLLQLHSRCEPGLLQDDR